jgi:hypothetical protein
LLLLLYIVVLEDRRLLACGRGGGGVVPGDAREALLGLFQARFEVLEFAVAGGDFEFSARVGCISLSVVYALAFCE